MQFTKHHRMAKSASFSALVFVAASFTDPSGFCSLAPASTAAGVRQHRSRNLVAVARGRATGTLTASAFTSSGFRVARSDGFPLDSYGLLKVERRSKFEESLGLARAVPAYILSFSCAVLMCLTMVLSFPFVKLLDPVKRVWTDKCNMLWARVTALPFFAVRVVNPEHLPLVGDSRAYVYISNHQSFMDILSMYFLGRSFKWVSKASIKKIPIIGWAMTLTGHVFLQREDTRSQIKTIRECVYKLKNGASMFLFPEGTRSKTGRLGEFEKGAFSIAKMAHVGIVPITVMGTGDVMPPGREFRIFRSPGVNVVVHPIISAEEVQSFPHEELKAKARELIHSGLPPSMKGGSC